ncbi:PRC-barrel domain-containing protein [Qingshengfaniella alkalisoli]|uniref:PRC-barrel domain-containing protein n=1 Tax=Qingshengfaniella alkalisoli TaxID=2599296 RepID=A0A5B8IYT4_9RHOB|nr:PRC-barrel domain-containing protein [Qingshengfaniella alkalisoli]QDY71282.1 hypothetical protein FPZ52_16480 [Qingshengfaniella alkalisoli]
MKRIMTTTALAALLMANPLVAQEDTSNTDGASDTEQSQSEAPADDSGAETGTETEPAAEPVAPAEGEDAEGAGSMDDPASEPVDGAEAPADDTDMEAMPEGTDATGGMDAPAEGDSMEAPAEGAETTDPFEGNDTAGSPDYQPEGFVFVEAGSYTAEQLTGAAVFDLNEDRIGEVNDVLVDGDAITNVIIDVGGFLGIGEKPVSLDVSEVDVMQATEGGEVRAYVSQTKEMLKELPRYEGPQ